MTAPIGFQGALGPAYPAIVDGRLAAILYWADAEPGLWNGVGGDPIVTPPGWFLVLADDPDVHEHIEAPGLDGGLTHDELVDATGAAMAAATGILIARGARGDGR